MKYIIYSSVCLLLDETNMTNLMPLKFANLLDYAINFGFLSAHFISKFDPSDIYKKKHLKLTLMFLYSKKLEIHFHFRMSRFSRPVPNTDMI